MDKNQHPLQRDGTGQKRRFPAGLDPSYVKVDERSMNDLLDFARNYSRELKFYNADPESPDSWKNFLGADNSILRDINERSDFQPHFALFITFLRLFKYAEDDLNLFTKRHLDFYYEKVLGLMKQEGEPDKVHVIFELAKNVSEKLLKAGTAVDAGKDAKGKPRNYRTDSDIIVNKAKISDLRSVFCPPEEEGVIRFASVANSGDGIGGELDKNNPQWDAFGNPSLPVAQIGFALASPVLLLNEGERKVKVIISFSHQIEIPEQDVRENAINLSFSGEKDWIGPFTVTPAILRNRQNRAYGISIEYLLGPEQPAVVNFNKEKLSGSYDTSSPIVQIRIANPAFLAWIRDARVEFAKIDVDVSGVQSLNLENDQGPLDSKKPFMPFGSQPSRGSSFYAGYEELLRKDIDSLNLNFEWLDVPANLNTYYSSYRRAIVSYNRLDLAEMKRGGRKAKGRTKEVIRYPNISFTADLFLNETAKGKVNLFNTDNATLGVTIPGQAISHRRRKTSTRQRRSAIRNYRSGYRDSRRKKASEIKLQLEGFEAGELIPEELKSRFIRLELNRDFGHRDYPKLLVRAIQNKTKIPNQPYTPTIKTISLSYKASTERIFIGNSSAESFYDREIQFFHDDVFGSAEQHGYLKSLPSFAVDRAVFLIPQHRSEGEFYFSLEDASPLQTTNVLFQVAEGSANPEKEAQEIHWFILCDDEWRALTSENILSDTTNHLLTSGIIKFYLPAEGTDNNSLFDSGKYWIKVVVEKNSDAVSRFIALHTQAVQAVYDDEENDINHLATALPANTISKMATKEAAIKKVEQPYASFGGRMMEDETSFYTRISERLRHKQRAVSAWDYERIVLQQFPAIYKVKCLNHSTEDEDCCSHRRPGHVTLILIPDLKNKNAVNPLQPRVSLNTLTAVENYLKKLHSPFVILHTQNAEFEELQLDFRVRFRKNFEFGYYSKKLNEEIIRYLSPWAFDPSAEISFGGRVHKSVILNFIEELEYVDFVTDFRMYHLPDPASQRKDLNEIEVSNPRAILVSASQHLISLISENEDADE